MAKAPAVQMYAADFLVDVSEFNNGQVGAYTRLLFTQWVNGDLPMELNKLANIASEPEEIFTNKIWPTIKIKFKVNENNRYYNERLEKSRQSKNRFLEGASLGGKTSANEKKAKKAGKEHVVVLPWLEDVFCEAWAKWKKYKLDSFKFKYKTEISEQTALDNLKEMAGDDHTKAIKLINFAIDKQWKGIYVPYELQKEFDKKKPLTEKKTAADYGNL